MKKLCLLTIGFIFLFSANVLALSSATSGSITADGTEQTLTTQTVAASYQLIMDLKNMVAGDVLEIRMYTKYASGGTSRLAYYAVYNGKQGRPIIQSIPVPVDTEIKVSIEQSAGTNREYYYNLLRGGTITSVADGTQTATLDTWHTLSTQTTAGVYILVIDASNLANGDLVRFQIKSKYASGGTSGIVYKAAFAHDQYEEIIYSIAVVTDTEVVFQLYQDDGTGRAFYWNVLRIG